MSQAWTHPFRLHEIARGPIKARLEPDEAQRAALAKTLGLRSLPAFVADVTVKPWFDGAEIAGNFRATVEQTCSLSLEPFHQQLNGDIFLRVVPEGSPQAQELEGGELELDLEAPDPPDVLENETVDIAAYVVEQLVLEIDPFPRKPGATFEFAPPPEEESPFAVLKKLNQPKD